MRDAIAHGGPLAGLAAGLVALADIDRGFDGPAVVVGGDMPQLVPAVLALLAATVDADPAIGGASLEADPPCVLPLAIRPSLAHPVIDALLREDRRALRALLDRLPMALVAGRRLARPRPRRAHARRHRHRRRPPRRLTATLMVL